MRHRLEMVKTGKTTFCGDHYCTGHTDKSISCTCGKELWRGNSSVPNSDTQRILLLEHRMELLEQ